VRCFVVAGFLLTSASRGPSAIAEPLVFIYTPFLSNSPTGQTVHHIFTLNGSNDADSRKGVPFLAFVDIAPHFGDHIAQKPQFLGHE